MRKKRAKFLRNLVRNNDHNLLISIRNKYGSKTEDMDFIKIFRAAKKLWSSKISDCKFWGNPIRMSK